MTLGLHIRNRWLWGRECHDLIKDITTQDKMAALWVDSMSAVIIEKVWELLQVDSPRWIKMRNWLFIWIFYLLNKCSVKYS